MPETTRKIFFYRALQRDAQGNTMPFDPAALVREARGLPNSMNGRSMQVSDGTRVTIHVDSARQPRLRIRFGKTRTKDIPFEETGVYDLRELQVDPAGGTSDVIHVAFYNNGIVGHVYNHAGPTMGQLATFVERRCPNTIPNHRLDFAPLVHPDALRAIMEYEKLRAVTFTIDGGAGDFVNNARASRPLLLAARDVHNVGNPVTIQVTVSRIQDDESVKQVVTDIFGNRALAGAIRQVKVHGTNYEEQEGSRRRKAHRSAVDLFSQDLIFEEKILAIGENKRTLDDNSAYSTMDEVHANSRESLEAAAHIE